jgi:hypothetical protein
MCEKDQHNYISVTISTEERIEDQRRQFTGTIVALCTKCGVTQAIEVPTSKETL